MSDIFSPIRYLLASRDDLTAGNAVDIYGALYDDVAQQLADLLALETSLHGLIQDCDVAGLQSKALSEIKMLLEIKE